MNDTEEENRGGISTFWNVTYAHMCVNGNAEDLSISCLCPRQSISLSLSSGQHCVCMLVCRIEYMYKCMHYKDTCSSRSWGKNHVWTQNLCMQVYLVYACIFEIKHLFTFIYATVIIPTFFEDEKGIVCYCLSSSICPSVRQQFTSISYTIDARITKPIFMIPLCIQMVATCLEFYYVFQFWNNSDCRDFTQKCNFSVNYSLVLWFNLL